MPFERYHGRDEGLQTAGSFPHGLDRIVTLSSIVGASSPEVPALAPARVLIVAPQPFYQDRGTPIAIRQVMEALSQLSYDIDILTFPIGEPVNVPRVRVIRSANPLRIRRVPVGLSGRKLALDFSLVHALAGRLARERYCCIHAVEEAGFPAIWLGRQYGVPVIYDMQSSLPEQLSQYPGLGSAAAQRWLRRCERWLLRHATLVVTSVGLGQHARRVVPEARVHEWHYSSDLAPVSAESVAALRDHLQIPPSAPVVVYSGTFEWYQGLAELLASVPDVKRVVPDVVFVLVGGTDAALTTVRRQTHRMRLDGSVHVLGRQPRREVARYLQMADVLVSTRAHGEGLPLKAIDYLAAGRPIVASGIASHRGLLTEERAVLVRHDPNAIASAISGVLTNPARAAELSAGARAYAQEFLSWTAFVEAVDQLYREARAGERPSRAVE